MAQLLSNNNFIYMLTINATGEDFPIRNELRTYSDYNDHFRSSLHLGKSHEDILYDTHSYVST